MSSLSDIKLIRTDFFFILKLYFHTSINIITIVQNAQNMHRITKMKGVPLHPKIKAYRKLKSGKRGYHALGKNILPDVTEDHGNYWAKLVFVEQNLVLNILLNILNESLRVLLTVMESRLIAKLLNPIQNRLDQKQKGTKVSLRATELKKENRGQMIEGQSGTTQVNPPAM